MSNSVIAAVPLDEGRLVVWFGNGASREYSAHDLDCSQSALSDTEVLPEGTGLRVGAHQSFETDDLYALGKEVDYVNDEKIRILKSLSSIRREAGFSQTRLGEAAGIRQSVISRIEGCEISPQINTLLKLLAPLGKTLEIVDLK
jgi:DNA-binding XRE family transcriptional regulator